MRAGVLMFHPGAGVFVQHGARALYDAGLLERFATTLIDRPDHWLRRGLCRAAGWAGFDLDGQFKRRAVTQIPVDLVATRPAGEILRLLAARLDPGGRVADRIWEHGEHRFDRWVSSLITASTDTVYGFEHAAEFTFAAAKGRGLRCVYEVPAPEHEFVNAVLQREYQRRPELQSAYTARAAGMRAARTARRRREWRMADLVIVNSEFTKASFDACGLDTGKVRVIPLGAPPVAEAAADASPQTPLKVIWAGNFSVLKGAHYMLQAWARLDAGDRARLDVYGRMGLPAGLVQNFRSPDIRWSATIPHAELMTKFRHAHVLVLPTLCDGFGMVITEALAQGLPVITTPNAGASRLIRDGENGWLVAPGDPDAIAGALNWCLSHPRELHRMRSAAMESARAWQWRDFRRSLVEAVAGMRDGSTA